MLPRGDPLGAHPVSRLDELIDELEQRLATLTPEEQRDLAELLGRAARTAGVTTEVAARRLVELSHGFARYLAPRPDQQCQPPEARPPWHVRCRLRSPCARPSHCGEVFCAAGLQLGRDLPI